MNSEELICFIEQEEFNNYEEGLKAFNNQRRVLKRLIKKYSDNDSANGFVMGLTVGDGVMVKKIHYYKREDGREFGRGAIKTCSNRNDKSNIHMYVYGDYANKIALEFEENMNKRHRRSYPNERFKLVLTEVRQDYCWSLKYIERMSPLTKAIYTTWKKYLADKIVAENNIPA